MGSIPENHHDKFEELIPLNKTHEPKLLINVLEEKAKWLSNHTFMRYPSANWELDGYRTITWKQYADTINKIAHWLDAELGKSTGNETVAYLGPNDARYAIMLGAMVKTGRQLFVPDGRVTKDGLKSLIEQTKCMAWIYAGDDARKLANEVGVGLQLCEMPALEWCLDSEGGKRYEYTKSFDEAKWDVILVIHTSGTTGTPKPIYHTNGFWACSSSYHTLSRNYWPRGIAYDTWTGKVILTSCPPQWLAGMCVYVFLPVFFDTSSVITPPDITSLPPLVFQKILQLNMVDGIMDPPHTIVQLYKDLETQPLLKGLKFVVYLGAALDREVGDELCEYTKLTSIIGSTETGPQPDIQPIDRKLWYTHDYVLENGSRMELVPNSGIVGDGSDDLYELVLERSPGKERSYFQSAFWNPMWKDETRVDTKEMYSPVKDVDGRTRWQFSARKDDLTKLSWLAKFHATEIETRIRQHPEVSNVFVGGEGRPTPYVIIEPRGGVKDEKTLLDLLYYGVIAHSSEDRIEEIRIPRETVMLAKKEKPFRLSAKQTVLRRVVEADYEEEIEEAYRRLERVNGAQVSSK